jgi:hypothetical protein
MFGWFLESVIPDFDYAFHVDLEDEEKGLSEPPDALLKTFYCDPEFAKTTVTIDGREVILPVAVWLRNRKVRMVPDGLTPEEVYEVFAAVSEAAMEVGKQGASAHLSSDEAHNLIPDIGDDLDQRIERMLSGGRKKGIEWSFCTQRPAKLHAMAFTQMNYGIFFHLPKDADRMKVNGSVGFDAYHMLEDMGERECYIENADTSDLQHLHTEDLERETPHYAKDDGIADGVLDAAGESVSRSVE